MESRPPCAREYAVRNVCVGGDFERMDAALAFLRKVNSEECELERWTLEWAQVVDAALDSVSLAGGCSSGCKSMNFERKKRFESEI